MSLPTKVQKTLQKKWRENVRARGRRRLRWNTVFWIHQGPRTLNVITRTTLGPSTSCHGWVGVHGVSPFPENLWAVNGCRKDGFFSGVVINKKPMLLKITFRPCSLNSCNRARWVTENRGVWWGGSAGKGTCPHPWVQSLGFTQWKERNESPKLLPDLHINGVLKCTHTHTHTK